MRFTLMYDGELPSRGSARDKEAIRERLNPQLRELWTHQPLCLYPEYINPKGENELSVLERIGEHVYAPLVCEPLQLLAELDIMILRPERPGGVVTSGGDIDNRLKTLFDALSIPSQPGAIAANARPSSPTKPMFTLLSDDSLISRVNVETDRLLDAPSPSHVWLTIRVTLRARKIIFGNQLLIA